MDNKDISQCGRNLSRDIIVENSYIEPYIKLFGKKFLYTKTHPQGGLYYTYSRFQILVTPGKYFSFHCNLGHPDNFEAGGFNVMCNSYAKGIEFGLGLGYKEHIENSESGILNYVFHYKKGIFKHTHLENDLKSLVNNDLKELLEIYIVFM